MEISQPKVSIIIPTYNEELFLVNCVDSILKNKYPKQQLEIILIDGLSTDKTTEIAKEIIEENKEVSIQLISNPKKTFPCAVNLGVKDSTGDFIMILGAHAVYDEMYIPLCVENSLKYDADNVGGILNTIGLNQSLTGKLITNVLSSPFGVGNSVFRTGTDKVTEVDTVFGGFYKRSVFDKIGYFNENLRSSSDMDFNVRLKKTGGKIILDPLIIATYYTRSDFGKFMKNNWRNGFWAIYPLRFVDYLPVSIRHLIPLFFICGVIGGSVLSLFSNVFLFLFLGVLSLYVLLSFYFSIPFVKKGFANIIFMPFLFLFLHLTYGCGSLLAIINVVFFKVLNIIKR
ncbi:MAG: glycosyltransferase family 2 protein [Bacteroidetes bacterium]|nr:glycosyltransferase family 2 protein [Bacteroidota bacterium]